MGSQLSISTVSLRYNDQFLYIESQLLHTCLEVSGVLASLDILRWAVLGRRYLCLIDLSGIALWYTLETDICI